MEHTELLENEQIITESTNNVVTLTTHRVRYNSSSTGQAHIVSIMLEKVSSIEVHYKSFYFLLVIGIMSAIAGVAIGMGLDRVQNSLGMPILLGGVVCVVIYLFTRKHVVSIASDGGAKINFETKGMKRETVIGFINKIETAKHKLTK